MQHSFGSTLRLWRGSLNSAEEWLAENQNQGLYFLFPKEGTGSCIGGGGNFRLSSGDAIVLSSNSHWTVTPEPGGLVLAGFCLRLEHLFPLFDGPEICLLEHVAAGFQPAKWYPVDGALARECHRLLAGVPATLNLEQRTSLLRVAAVILNFEFTAARARSLGFVSTPAHRLGHLEKLSAEDLLQSSVEELAAKLGCSRRHLSRLSHHRFGASVSSLKMEMRLLKASSLLLSQNATVARVAQDCGFKQAGRFNTCFKRRFGATPGQWRKQKAPAGSDGNHSAHLGGPRPRAPEMHSLPAPILAEPGSFPVGANRSALASATA